MQLGIKVWFDKYEINVGDSITRKINDGIKTTDFLGIILSPNSVKSEWVWNELGPVYMKQMLKKKKIILPILYQNCEIPDILIDKKYVDFRNEFNKGFEDLALTLGIKKRSIISLDSWREYRKKTDNWKDFRLKEYKLLVTKIVDLAFEYNWSVWTGGNDKFSMTISAHLKKGSKSISLILNKNNNNYYASFNKVINPNNLQKSDFKQMVGNSINECEEYVWRFLKESKKKNGVPTSKPFYHVTRFSKKGELETLTFEIVELIKNKISYYEGDKIRL